MNKYKPGDLISRYSKMGSTKGHCVVVDIDSDNYTLYNNSLKCLQRVACAVVDRLYMPVIEENKAHPDANDVFEMT